MKLLFINKLFIDKHLYVECISYNMVQDKDIYEHMPFFVLTYSIYKNKLDYSIKNPNNLDLNQENRYLMQIYQKEGLSQDDLANLFGQSKATIAKHLRTLEDEGYIIREVDENNRRKYILKTTEKGKQLAILKIKDLQEWNDKVGISDLDDKTLEKIRDIARKSAELLKD